MKKILLILSSSIFMATSISNLSNVTYNLNSNLQKNIANKIATNSQKDESLKLESWHNSLSIEQDEQAKQAYENAMQITTTKIATSNLDTYNIGLDNIKLKTMLKNKLINQDVYNIWQNINTAKTLTMEANEIITLPTKNNENIKVRAFQSNFYIKNNKFYFVDKDHQNPYAFNFKSLKTNLSKHVSQILPPVPPGTSLKVITRWYNLGNFTAVENDAFVDYLNTLMISGYSELEIEFRFYQLLMNLIIEGEISQDILMMYYVDLNYNNKQNFSSKYFGLNSLEKNWDQIKAASDKYHMGASETFYFWGLYMDPNSIQSLPPMTKTSEINDEDEASYFNRGKKIINEYDNVPLLDYNGYDSLWQYLNTDGEAFNLNKIFKSYVGVLGKYNDLNYTFHHLEATAILKPYLNTWVTLTKTSWNNYNRETSLAQMQMMISDNPLTKTIEFHFKSILCNVNAIDSVGNEMYY